MLLGTIVRELGWDVKVYVEDIAEIDYQEVLTADLVGISTITSTARKSYAIADALREYGVPVVMGGPHVTFLVPEALNHCDYVVRGEGERALPLLIKALFTGGELANVPNLSYLDASGEVCNNQKVEPVRDLDSLPYPDFSLIQGWKWASGFSSKSIIPFQTTRGCPYDCQFCSVVGMFGRKMRYRSVDNVIGELEYHNDPGMHAFFYDDNFTANKRWAKDLLTKLADRPGLLNNWSSQVRIDATTDEQLLGLMKKTNCSNVYVGFETVNPDALKEMRKKQDVGQIQAAIKKFAEFDINVHGMFILGFDSDTKKSIKATTRFAVDSGINSAQFLILTPLPGTPLFDSFVQQDRLIASDWSHFDAHHVVYKPSNISTWELQWAQLKAHAMFYSRLRALKNLAHGYVTDSLIYLYARKLNQEYRRANRVYLKALRLAERARGFKFSFDLEIDLSEIKKQVQIAAGALLKSQGLPLPV